MSGQSAVPPPVRGTAPANAVLVTNSVPEQRTAWTKARRDVMRTAEAMGYGVVPLPPRLFAPGWRGFLQTLQRALAPGGSVLVEYPFDQRRRLYPLVIYCRWRGVRLHGLIHDLDALRFDTPVRRETAILNLFDGLVSHNPAMTRWLRDSGVRRPISELGVFDYLAEAGPAWHEEGLSGPVRIACAGNLSCSKARYVYDPRWREAAGVQVSLFGAFFEPGRLSPDVPLRYRGSFTPDAPALDARYHFGLVWDGDSIAGGEGRYGRYMRFNNPHKLSLYAALGLPVVVWEEAAVARFVHDEGVGVAVRDLRDLGQLPHRVSPSQYRAMTGRMTVLRQSVTRGDFLRRALRRLGAPSGQAPQDHAQALQNG